MAKKINIDDTRFIFKTNFSCDPSRTLYVPTYPEVNLIVSRETADELSREGVTVKQTRPGEMDDPATFVPTYFVKASINMNSKYPPSIYWVTTEGRVIRCDSEMLKQLDYIYVKKVDCQCNISPKKNKPGEFKLWVDIMYITQDADRDPYYNRYHAANEEGSNLPF